jgi:hypothetical protein
MSGIKLCDKDGREVEYLHLLTWNWYDGTTYGDGGKRLGFVWFVSVGLTSLGRHQE